LIGSNVHARGCRPVDDKILSQPAGLLIGRYVSQFRLLSQLCKHSFRPYIEFTLIRVFQCVLELVTAGAIIDREVLHGLHIEMYAFHMGQSGSESTNYRCCVCLTFRKWLQIDLDSSTVQRCICPIHSNEGGQAGDCRILQNDFREFLLFQSHRTKRDRLRSLGDALDNSYILCWEETFRDDNVKRDGDDQRCSRHQKCRNLVAKNPAQGSAVLCDKSFKHML
jgi:hypothetical protein